MQRKDEGRAALVTFIMAGDPDYETSLAIAKALPKAGADVIELGMPFTDPMADGPAIQAAGLRALKAGQDLKKTLAMVREFRTGDSDTPIVLMGYYNPIYIYGVDKFLADAKGAGVDGLIIVDLPPEEDEELCLPALKAGLNFIRLATPTTDDKRLPAVLANTSGFVYYVSITGITGAADARCGESVGSAVARIKRHTKLPVAVGFGVQDRRAGAGDRAKAPTAWWSARRWSTRCAAASIKTARRPEADRQSRQRSGLRAGARRARGSQSRPRNSHISRRSVIFASQRFATGTRCMNWISNVVRPKIRSFLRRETPENLWIKCPETGQLVFYKDVEANQFVIPSSNYHMRISAPAPAQVAVRRRRIRRHRDPRGADRSAEIPRRAPLCRPPQGRAHQDRHARTR